MMVNGKELPLEVTIEEVVFVPSEEGFFAYIREVPGLTLAIGETEEEAFEKVNSLLKSLKILRQTIKIK